MLYKINSVKTRKLKGVNPFHYYLCRQQEGGGTEVKMYKGYVWQGEYGKRSHLKPILKKILDEQDAISLTMLALFVNNNPYNLEFYIALNYDRPENNHIQEMKYLFENANLKLRNDLTTLNLVAEMGNRRFDSYIINDSEQIDTVFASGFCFSEINELERKGYCMKPYGKDKQVFISYSSNDREDVKKLIPYLNGMDLPVWFDENNISIGQSITESVQSGIEQSEMVIFWVTQNFLRSKWCRTEMNAFIKKMIDEKNILFLMLDDEVEINELPLFVRDIKHIRRENRSIPDLVEILAREVKSAIGHQD